MVKPMTFFLFVVVFVVVFSGCAQMKRSAPPEQDKTIVKVSTGPRATVIVSVVGKGIPPEHAVNRGQAALMGERAAVADGYRKLVEKVRGVFIDAYSRVGNGSVDHDLVQAETQAWLRGAETLKVVKKGNEIYEAYMRLRISVSDKHVLWAPLKSMPESM